MKTTEIIRRYVDAWNSHDSTALVAAFTKDGTYCSPHTYPGLNMESFAEFAKSVWTSFPDLHVELLNAGEIEAGGGYPLASERHQHRPWSGWQRSHRAHRLIQRSFHNSD
jgi:SnoaL-like domain